MEQKTRVGIIGCGGMARTHASRMSAVLDRVEVTAVVDLEQERAQAVADHLPNDPTVATDYEAILDLVDAVLVVLPHHLHHPVTVRCLNAGKHVLVEKPMANSEQECLAMIEAANRNERVLMVAYCLRFHPPFLEFKEAIDSGDFGRVFQLSIWTEQLTQRDPDNWMCRADTLGGGQFFSHGCHYVDAMLWMLGKPVRGIHLGSNLCTPWMEREGTSNMCVEFESGALGYHFGTWGARGTRLGYSFHAHCEKGMIELNLAKGQVLHLETAEKHVPADEGPRQKEVVLFEQKHAKPTEVEMAHFIDCIETGKSPLTDPVSSLEGLRVIWKLYEAEEAGTMADLKGLGLGTMGRAR